jgi:hypothetical protein
MVGRELISRSEMIVEKVCLEPWLNIIAAAIRATECIFGADQSGKRGSLSDAMHWAIIDLPGLIQGNKKKKKDDVLDANGDGAR